MTGNRCSRAVLLLGAALLVSQQALAQGGGNGPGWFIPGQPAPGAARPAPRTVAPAARTPAATEAPVPSEEATEPNAGPLQAQLPPAPTVPDVSRGAMPPAAVIGVLSIPDVLRASSAYREADKVMAERRQKLNEDAQKEQVALRDMGQQLANDRGKMTADQIRTRERQLQDRITASRRTFAERGRIIQEASQYALAQIERTLSDVVQRVAAARGMNLVLQRAEVALNQAEFDITPQVADILNKTLPTVLIPPDGVSPTAPPATASAAPVGKVTPASRSQVQHK